MEYSSNFNCRVVFYCNGAVSHTVFVPQSHASDHDVSGVLEFHRRKALYIGRNEWSHRPF